ncbi:MAG: hypothetical protein GY775_20735, partial [Candidatus Scalindua sp.]|nr:hypothetical protein [Candidatus Scalindua sp.]
GSVKDSSLSPFPEIVVSIHGHPEYGTVQTDSVGVFSIPVEGGGTLTLEYKKDGFITSHRQVYVPWKDIAVADTITMILEDNASTTIVFDETSSDIITHKSTTVIDAEFGDRSVTMLISKNNKAYSIDENGDSTALTEITTRATEFETPESMPAELPPNSAFTYCAELSVDGVNKVRFDNPVPVFVNNFLGFDVGELVPVGYYDRERAVWVPSENGVVVKLLDTDSDGVVDALDNTGDDMPDDLVAGLDDPLIYVAGSTYWRFETDHFSPWDCNWPFGPPIGAIKPNPKGEPNADKKQKEKDPCFDDLDYTSSYVERKSRIFHEDIPISGTNFTLHYASSRVSGYKTVLNIPVSGDTVPESLNEIKVSMQIAGQLYEHTLDPLPDQKIEQLWDGLDYLGNRVKGDVKVVVNIGFVYDAVYYSGGDFDQSFAQVGSDVTSIKARQEIT